MEVFKPTMYVTLCISDTNVHSSFSAIEKSVNVSNRLFKSCLERHHQSEVNIFTRIVINLLFLLTSN